MRVLFFYENEGAEVEALDLRAGLHVLREDGAGEGVDEGLRTDGVVLVKVGGSSWWELFRDGGGEVFGKDLGLEIKADLFGGERALDGVGVSASGTGAVVIGVEADEVEELGGVGRDVGVTQAFLTGVGGGDGRECEIVALVREGGRFELVADEGVLRLSKGDVAYVDGMLEGVGLAIGATAGVWVEELIVPDEGLTVAGDAGIGFDGGDEVVEAGLKGGESVFGTEATAATVGGDVEVGEALGFAGGRDRERRASATTSWRRSGRSEMMPSTPRRMRSRIFAGSLVVQGTMRKPCGVEGLDGDTAVENEAILR